MWKNWEISNAGYWHKLSISIFFTSVVARLECDFSLAGVVELADTPDLGSGASAWEFKSLPPQSADYKKIYAEIAQW